MPNSTVSAAAIGLPSSAAADAILDDDRSRTIGASHLSYEPLWDAPVLASAAPPAGDEPGIQLTDAGRTFLLLQEIIARLHVEGDQATFTIAPEMADELAAFGSESEDLEDDDPAEESEPDEDSHDAETDVWFEEVP
jgi:hypothetical protein